ncbi:MAG: tRNA 2-thiouridine(34) synthase MnmA [Bacteroidetes bacterium]|nr:tRNA 2-thiouridine(34) synthase MnmA [Bacteroidota bacterium]
MEKKHVVIGMSGGVDSSVAAYILKQQGYEVTALFMRNWHDTTGMITSECTWEDDRNFAEMVSRKLDIPFHHVDLSVEYRERVVDYMFSEYEKGRTPNPDVLCNREIKFDAFMKEALKLGADYVATGHYCRKETIMVDGKERYRLLAGCDNNKDQSYFLCQLSQEQLEKALFPIGDLDKSVVRAIATEQKLATAQRKDSQGICFVGKVNLPVFLQQKLKAKKGDIIEIPNSWGGYDTDMKHLPYIYKPEDGIKVGEHNGAQYYTMGQRKGLNVGGKAEPLFIIATDIASNVIYVGQGKTHKGLQRKALFIRADEMHWLRPDLEMNEGEERRYKIRIRYRQPLQDGYMRVEKEGAYIFFDEPQRSITAGQFAACYTEDHELVFSGVINE